MTSRREDLAEGVTLYLGDCREILPTIGQVDAVVTDPPYPDFYAEEYHYREDGIDFLKALPCRQFVFWSGDLPFPLTYSAAHIWNKNPSNHGAQYEKIYERNGNKQRMVLTHYMVNSTVAASFARDVFTGHPSQKPITLITDLLTLLPDSETVFDPFSGSGTTGVACVRSGKKFIGVEINPQHFDLSRKRISEALKQGDMFIDKPKPVKQEQFI